MVPLMQLGSAFGVPLEERMCIKKWGGGAKLHRFPWFLGRVALEEGSKGAREGWGVEGKKDAPALVPMNKYLLAPLEKFVES